MNYNVYLNGIAITFFSKYQMRTNKFYRKFLLLVARKQYQKFIFSSLMIFALRS